VSVVIFSVIAGILVLAGLAGVFVPLLPGIPLAWAGLFIYAIGTGFERISVVTVVVFSVVMVLILVLDFLAPMLGAKKYRATKWGMLGAFLGSIAGIITLGPAGIILGPILGAFLFELLASKPPSGAFKSALGAALGFIAGALVKLVYLLILAGFIIASWFQG
jgi:uncharacterized protein YqgC (DUF456 family)